MLMTIMYDTLHVCTNQKDDHNYRWQMITGCCCLSRRRQLVSLSIRKRREVNVFVTTDGRDFQSWMLVTHFYSREDRMTMISNDNNSQKDHLQQHHNLHEEEDV